MREVLFLCVHAYPVVARDATQLKSSLVGDKEGEDAATGLLGARKSEKQATRASWLLGQVR